MEHDSRTIKNLEEIEAMLSARLDEVCYLTVVERFGSREEQLAKLPVPDLPDWTTAADRKKQVEGLLEALCRELLGLASGSSSPFRVSIYAAKGERLLTRTVTVVDTASPSSAERVSVEEVATEVEGRALRQVGAAWEHFGKTVMSQAKDFSAMCLTQMGAVDEISRKQTELTAKETAAARAQVNELVGQVSSAQLGAAEAKVQLMKAEALGEVEEERKQVESDKQQAGQELAKEALGKLGELGQALLTTKMGIPPELSEVSLALQSNPAMMEALRDPKVREQLKSAENLDYLATMLRQAADVAEQQAAQSEQPGSSQESPT